MSVYADIRIVQLSALVERFIGHKPVQSCSFQTIRTDGVHRFTHDSNRQDPTFAMWSMRLIHAIFLVNDCICYI